MMLVILMQRPNTNAGMGAAFGGGVTESTFGAETTNILTRATKWSAGAFFVLAVLLYALYLVKIQPAPEESIEIEVGTVEGAAAGDATAASDAFTEALLTPPVVEATEIPAEAATTVVTESGEAAAAEGATPPVETPVPAPGE